MDQTNKNSLNTDANRSPEKRSVTILYADIVNSSHTVSGISPDDAADFLDPVIECMIQAVHAYGGKVLRVMGDGVNAVFGIGKQHEDHPIRAILAGNKLLNDIQSLQPTLNIPKAETRVGIHSGYVIVRWQDNDFGGNLDTVGSAVHVAAKIEESAEPNMITLSGTTASLVEDLVKTHKKPGIQVFDEDIYWIKPKKNLYFLTHISPSKPTREIVGRDQDLEEIENVIFGGGGPKELYAHMGIVGEAGIGKSRIIQNIVNSAVLRNVRVHAIGGYSVYKDSPYYVLKKLVQQLLLLKQNSSYERSARVIQEFSSDPNIQLALSFLTTTNSKADLRTLQTDAWLPSHVLAVQALIQKIVSINSLLLVIEDWHFVDMESMKVLERVFSNKSDLKCKVIISGRPEAKPAMGKFLNHFVRLKPLSSKHSLELARLVRGPDAEASSHQINEAVIRSEGLPLAIIEFSKMSPNSNSPDAHTPLPLALESLLRQRIEKLSENSQKLISIASVIGSQIDIALLSSFMADSPSRTAAIQEVVEQGILSWHNNNRLKFEHQLYQDACYNGLTRQQRQPMHKRVVEAFHETEQTSFDYQFQAYHAEQAGLLDDALDLLWIASKEASQNAAIGTLRSLYYRAAAICDLIGTDESKLRKIRFAARAYMAFQQLAFEQELVPLFQRALDHPAVADDPFLNAIILCNLSSALWLNGAKENTLYALQACTIAAELGNPIIEAQARFQLANSQFQAGKILNASQTLLGVSEPILNPKHGEELVISIFVPACQYRAFASWYLVELGEYEKAERLYEEAREIAIRIDHIHSQINCDLSLGYRLFRQGKFSEASNALSETYQLCLKHSHTGISSLVAAWASLALSETGENERAREVLNRELEFGHYKRRKNCWTAYIRLAQAKLFEKSGATFEALDYAQRALEISKTSNDPVHEAYARFEIWKLQNILNIFDSNNHFERAYKMAAECGMKPLMEKFASMNNELAIGASHEFKDQSTD